MVTKEDLIEDRDILSLLRERLSEVQVAKNALLAQIMSSEAFLALISREKGLKESLELTETRLRTNAVELYKVDPSSKEIIPGINIRETTKIDYDPTIAKSYAMKHLMFLKLDEKAFEKYAKDQKETDAELDFVTILKQPSATIATDLSKFLPESTK